jgi:hypothetical protein
MSRCDERLKVRVETIDVYCKSRKRELNCGNMTYIHWVARQNKLEIPNDEEVNTREIYKCDGQTYDPDTMVVPLTPKTPPIFIF